MKQDLKIFDGHNDVLFRLYLKNKKNVHEDFLLGDNEGHLDLPRMNKAGFSGGLFAIYVPSQEEKIESADKPIRYDDMKNDSYIDKRSPKYPTCVLLIALLNIRISSNFPCK